MRAKSVVINILPSENVRGSENVRAYLVKTCALVGSENVRASPYIYRMRVPIL